MAKKKNALLSKVPPTELVGDALEHWNRIMPVLVTDGLVTKLDVPIIESACELYARYKVALFDEDDAESPLGYIKTYIAIMEKYGATAKSRQAMKITEPTKDKESDDLIKEFRMR